MENLAIESRDNRITLRFTGEITLDRAAAMKQVVEDATSAADYSVMLANLNGVTFIDSSGIGFLVALKTKTISLGKQMYITGLSDEVRKTFELVQLIDFFQVLDSEDDLI